MNNVGNTNLQLTNVFPGVEEEWLPQEVDTATPKGYSVRSKMQNAGKLDKETIRVTRGIIHSKGADTTTT